MISCDLQSCFVCLFFPGESLYSHGKKVQRFYIKWHKNNLILKFKYILRTQEKLHYINIYSTNMKPEFRSRVSKIKHTITASNGVKRVSNSQDISSLYKSRSFGIWLV